MSNTLKFGNGQWATKEGSTLAYNDENNNFKPLPFNFERASSATVVNKDGLIETVGSDMPRVDYKDDSEGALLLEPTRTNLLTYSEDFSHSSWSKTNSGTGSAPSVTSNYSISPDGTQNADRVVFDLNGGTANGDISQVSVTIGSVSSASYTNSVYIKSNTANDYDLVVTDPSGGFVVKSITNEWQRFDNLGTSVTNLSIRIRLRGDESTSDYADVSIWGAQIEEGSYATSYIPTQNSAVTRLEDVCNGAGNDQVINSSEGVLYAEISFLENNASADNQLSLSDGSVNNRVMIYPFSNTQLGLRFNANSSQLVSQTITVSSLSVNSKIAVRWGNGNYSLYQNGSEVYTQAIASTPIGLSKLNFSSATETAPFYGNTKDLRVYNTALTDAELQALTS